MFSYQNTFKEGEEDKYTLKTDRYELEKWDETFKRFVGFIKTSFEHLNKMLRFRLFLNTYFMC